MIVEWFIGIGTSFVGWLVASFPAWAVPDWFLSVDSSIQSVVAMAAGLGAWVDLGLAMTVVAAVVGTWVVCLLIKLALRAGSHIPGVGGAG